MQETNYQQREKTSKIVNADVSFFTHRCPAQISHTKAMQWSEDLQCWCVFDPTVVMQVLRSEQYSVIPFSKELMRYSKLLPVYIEGPTRVLDHIPLANEGPVHHKSRKAIVKVHNASYEKRLCQLRNSLSSLGSIFSTPGEHDLTDRIFHPCIDLATSTYLPSTPKRSGPGASQIFDRHLSLNRRKLVYDQINVLYKDEEKIEAGLIDQLIALRILGYDSLLGSIQESFISVINQQPGRSLIDIEWPTELPNTGVPWVERVSVVDQTLSGQSLLKGQKVRLFLTTKQSGSDIYFGSGRHKCVGAGLTQKIWQAFVQEFCKHNFKVEIIGVSYSDFDFVFNCPNKVLVLIYE